MTFLAKLGKALAQGVAVATGVWPIVSQFFGQKAQAVATTIINDLSQIGGIVTTVESVIQTPGSGAVKLAAAVPLVANVVRSSEMVAGHKVANEALFIQGCQKITDGTADILNSLDPNSVQTSGHPIAVGPAPQVPPAQ